MQGASRSGRRVAWQLHVLKRVSPRTSLPYLSPTSFADTSAPASVPGHSAADRRRPPRAARPKACPSVHRCEARSGSRAPVSNRPLRNAQACAHMTTGRTASKCRKRGMTREEAEGIWKEGAHWKDLFMPWRSPTSSTRRFGSSARGRCQCARCGRARVTHSSPAPPPRACRCG